MASSGAIPLNIYRPNLGRSKNLVTFTEVVRGKTLVQVLGLVRDIVSRWPAATKERITSQRLAELQSPLEGLRAEVKSVLLMSHNILKTPCQKPSHSLI